MKTKLLQFLTLVALVLTAPTTDALAAFHRRIPKKQTSALTQPVKSVFDSYLKIESALANESAVGIGFNASVIASAVRGDSRKMLPLKVARQAEILAGSRNLSSAREAFKPLSESIRGSLLPDGEGELDSKGQEHQQPLHGRFDAQLRNDQAEAMRIAIRSPAD
jgi:hypothetical protein